MSEYNDYVAQTYEKLKEKVLQKGQQRAFILISLDTQEDDPDNPNQLATCSVSGSEENIKSCIKILLQSKETKDLFMQALIEYI